MSIDDAKPEQWDEVNKKLTNEEEILLKSSLII